MAYFAYYTMTFKLIIGTRLVGWESTVSCRMIKCTHPEEIVEEICDRQMDRYLVLDLSSVFLDIMDCGRMAHLFKNLYMLNSYIRN